MYRVPASYERAKKSMELSLRWAKRCKKVFKTRTGYDYWYSSGGMFQDLRKKGHIK